VDFMMPWPGLSLIAVGRKPVVPGAAYTRLRSQEFTGNAR